MGPLEKEHLVILRLEYFPSGGEHFTGVSDNGAIVDRMTNPREKEEEEEIPGFTQTQMLLTTITSQRYRNTLHKIK